jgi:hypothetical protein
MPIEWDFGAAGEASNATQAATARELLEVKGGVSNEVGGDALGIIAASERVVSSEYHRPYETHARMEPINATVSVTDEDDVMLDQQRPPVYTRLTAALGGDGLPEAFFSRAVWFTKDGVERHGPATADYSIGTMPYRVPHRRTARRARIRTASSSSSSSTSWRSPATVIRSSGASR